MTSTEAPPRSGARAEGFVPAACRVFAAHLALGAVGGAALWASAFGLVLVVALVCWAVLALAVLAGVLLLVRRPTRMRGAGLVVGSVVAGCVQGAAFLALLVAYSRAYPGWDLS